MDLSELSSESSEEAEPYLAMQAWFKAWSPLVLAKVRAGFNTLQGIARESKRSTSYVHDALAGAVKSGFVDLALNDKVGVGEPKFLYKWSPLGEATLLTTINKTYHNGALKETFGFIPQRNRKKAIPREEIDWFCREHPDVVRQVLFGQSKHLLQKLVGMHRTLIPDALEILGVDRPKLNRLVKHLAPCIKLSRNKVILVGKFRAIKTITLMSK